MPIERIRSEDDTEEEAVDLGGCSADVVVEMLVD